MSFLEKPITVLKMGQRQHEVILAAHGKQLLSIMQKYDWTCHKCGIKIPEFMEIDHVAGHGNPDPQHLRPICTFCHAQDHIVWAAARKKVIPIMGPDLTNEQISRLAWAMMTLKSSNEDEARQALGNIRKALSKRHHDFISLYGADDADSLIESIYLFLAPKAGEEAQNDKKRHVVNRLLSDLRFFPHAVMADEIEEKSEGITRWGLGGFSVPPKTAEEIVRMPVPVPELIAAVVSTMVEEG